MGRKKTSVTPPKAPKLKKVIPGKRGRPRQPRGIADALAGLGGGPPVSPGASGPMPPMLKKGGKVRK